EAVLLQSNASPHPVGAPAPGANKAGSVYWFDSVRTEAVLLQSNAPPHHVGASAPGANGAGSVYWFDFASHRGGAPTIERVTPTLQEHPPRVRRTHARCNSLPALRTDAALLHSNARPRPEEHARRERPAGAARSAPPAR